MRKMIFVVLTTFLVTTFANTVVWGENVFNKLGDTISEEYTQIASGVEYGTYDLRFGEEPQKVHTIAFDPANPNLELQCVTANDSVWGTELVTSMADRNDAVGNSVVAAVNADFFDLKTGTPLGMLVMNGEIYATTSEISGGKAFAVKENDQSVCFWNPTIDITLSGNGVNTPIKRLNVPRNAKEDGNGIIMYNDRYHTTTKTASDGVHMVCSVNSGRPAHGETMSLVVKEIVSGVGDIPIQKGEVVLYGFGSGVDSINAISVGTNLTVGFNIVEEKWQDVKLAVGGNSLLIVDGEIAPGLDNLANPRTSIGARADGSIVLMVIDGRQPGFSKGVGLNRLAEMMKAMGCVMAINLDSGGSSIMVVKNFGEATRRIMNQPSDGNERKVTNGLMVVNKAVASGNVSDVIVTPKEAYVLSGSNFNFSGVPVDEGFNVVENADIKWNVTNNLGSIDKNGNMVAGLSGGVGEVTASVGNVKGSAKVQVCNSLTEMRFNGTYDVVSGNSTQMSVSAYNKEKKVAADNDSFIWSCDSNIGSIDKNGIFVANATGVDVFGKAYCSFGTLTCAVDIRVSGDSNVAEVGAVRCVANVGSAELSWTNPSVLYEGIGIDVSKNGSVIQVVNLNKDVNKATIYGLDYGENYKFVVKIKNVDGTFTNGVSVNCVIKRPSGGGGGGGGSSSTFVKPNNKPTVSENVVKVYSEMLTPWVKMLINLILRK